MPNFEVFRMNVLFGNLPKGGEGSVEEVWDQIHTQASLVLEEARELMEAVENRNMVEVLDAVVDLWVVREYMDDLLEACSINCRGAKEEIMKNNMSKALDDIREAEDTVEWYSSMSIGTYIELVKLPNEKRYIVKRDCDNKVMKPIGHKAPEISQFVPEEWK